MHSPKIFYFIAICFSHDVFDIQFSFIPDNFFLPHETGANGPRATVRLPQLAYIEEMGNTIRDPMKSRYGKKRSTVQWLRAFITEQGLDICRPRAQNSQYP